MVNLLPYVAGILAFAAARALGVHSVAMLAGGLVGLACGVLPYWKSRHKNPPFARTSLGVCVASGIVGGALLAVPTALVMTIIGLLKEPSADE